MTPNVPINERGTATLGMMVAERFRRKRKITITTKPTVSINSNSTSCTEARIVVVRSVRTITFTDAGKLLCKSGSNFFTRSTTWMMLAPGWRWMFMITAGGGVLQAAVFVLLEVSNQTA